MTKSLPIAVLLLLALVQLPFTYVGLSMALGYAREGPAYFDGLHRSPAGPGPRIGAAAPPPVAGAALAGLDERAPGAPSRF